MHPELVAERRVLDTHRQPDDLDSWVPGTSRAALWVQVFRYRPSNLHVLDRRAADGADPTQ